MSDSKLKHNGIKCPKGMIERVGYKFKRKTSKRRYRNDKCDICAIQEYNFKPFKKPCVFRLFEINAIMP